MVLTGVKPDHNLKEYLNSSGSEQVQAHPQHEIWNAVHHGADFWLVWLPDPVL